DRTEVRPRRRCRHFAIIQRCRRRLDTCSNGPVEGMVRSRPESTDQRIAVQQRAGSSKTMNCCESETCLEGMQKTVTTFGGLPCQAQSHQVTVRTMLLML